MTNDDPLEPLDELDEIDLRDAPDPGDLEDAEDAATAALLREVLHREAQSVRPSSAGLERILAAAHATRPPSQSPHDVPEEASRTAELPALRPLVASPGGPGAPGRRRSRGPAHWLPVLAAAAAMAFVVGGLGAVRLGVIHSARLAAVVGGPADTARPAPAPAPLPIYLAAQQNGRWALVREFAPTDTMDGGRRLTEALQRAVSGRGLDPDVTSVWANLGLTGDVTAQLSGGQVTVHLPQTLLGDTQTGATGPLARLAVQQLVWTATAVTGVDAPVRIVGPQPGDTLLGSLALDRTYARQTGAQDPRAPVWVNSVSDGQQLRRGAATVTGDAVVVDADGETWLTGATVGWLLVAPDGSSSTPGAVPLTRSDGKAPAPGERDVWELHLTLPTAGNYRLVMFQRWPGAPSGQAPWQETKTLTVS